MNRQASGLLFDVWLHIARVSRLAELFEQSFGMPGIECLLHSSSTHAQVIMHTCDPQTGGCVDHYHVATGTEFAIEYIANTRGTGNRVVGE